MSAGIRRLDAKDFDAFCNILDAFLRYSGDDQGLATSQKRQLFTKAVDPAQNYFVLGAFSEDAATKSSELVGIISLTFGESSYRSAPFAWCDDMYVHNEQRGSGIGRRLIEHAATLATDRGCSNVLLGVGNNDQQAQQFYADCGFIDLNNRLYSLVL